MRIIGIGDLVADIYYDKNKKLIGVDGGISVQNILCNLSYFGLNTYSFSSVSNDELGKICIKSLKDCNVNTSFITKNNSKTKSYYIYNILKDNKYIFKSTTICPYCNKDNWYSESFIDTDYILKNLYKDDILIFDNLNNKNQFIIDNTKNIKLLDLGLINEFESLNNNEIINKISNKFKIINFNERVFNYLLNRLNLKDLELIKLLNSDLIIVTKGKKGASYYLNNKEYFFELDNISEEIDDSGAGDISFSVIIKNYINNNFTVKENNLISWYKESTKYSSMIVKLIGSRTFIKPMYFIDEKEVCND